MQFSEVIGQDSIKEKLIQQVNKDKISHAQLFLGNNGFGTLPMALALAQYVFCSNKLTDDACGVCDACLKVKNLQHVDLHLIFPVVQEEKNKIAKGKIQEWKKLVQKDPYCELSDWNNLQGDNKKPIISASEATDLEYDFNLKAYEGGYKIAIIWMAHLMNTSCANKLLKLIEEPSPNTLIILIADDEDLILPTIRSRTQVLRFPRLKTEAIAKYLMQHKGFSNQNAQHLAIKANGDLKNLKTEEANEDSEAIISEYQLFSNQFMQLMRVGYKKDVLGMLNWVDEMNDKKFNRNKHKEFLKYCLEMMRQSMLKNYTGEQLLNVNEEEAKFLGNFAQFITGNNIFDFVDLFDKAYYHLDRNANPKILFTELCFNVMRYIRNA